MTKGIRVKHEEGTMTPTRLFEQERTSARGPKGARVGYMVVAGGRRWRVEHLDLERHEAICSGLRGSRSLRRFRAHQIEAVERPTQPHPNKQRQESLPI
jgi:hypothetical protein